jgi:hypothetical protein
MLLLVIYTVGYCTNDLEQYIPKSPSHHPSSCYQIEDVHRLRAKYMYFLI